MYVYGGGGGLNNIYICVCVCIKSLFNKISELFKLINHMIHTTISGSAWYKKQINKMMP